jgi:peptidoglycan/xylan/chitin deacetylase (PgdA/CDA1 family)
VSPVVSSVSVDEQLVALTFDDGPHEKYTPLVARVLNELSAPGTFFVRGGALTSETRGIVNDLDAAGHEVGNHTHHHLDLRTVDRSTVQEEVARTHFELEEITGRVPTLIRPPYGLGPAEVRAEAEAFGYRATVLWSASAVDYENPQSDADVMVDRVLHGYEEYHPPIASGGIVLMHDGCAPEQAGHSRLQTVETVRRLVPVLRPNGFRLVTVSELLAAGGLI